MMLSEKVIEKEEANFQRKHPQLDRSNHGNLKLTFYLMVKDSAVFIQEGNEAAMSTTCSSTTKGIRRVQ